MMRYILEKKLYQKEYVTEYTNASFILGKDYEFKDGLFSGYDHEKRIYDRKKWDFARDEKGVSLRDKTLQNPRCVFQLLQKHYDRYTLDMVSKVTGVSKQNLLTVYETFGATGKPDRAGTMKKLHSILLVATLLLGQGLWAQTKWYNPLDGDTPNIQGRA